MAFICHHPRAARLWAHDLGRHDNEAIDYAGQMSLILGPPEVRVLCSAHHQVRRVRQALERSETEVDAAKQTAILTDQIAKESLQDLRRIPLMSRTKVRLVSYRMSSTVRMSSTHTKAGVSTWPPPC